MTEPLARADFARLMLHMHRRPLTTRQAQVIAGVLTGRTNQEIADEIGVVIGTVKVYLSRAMDVLGLHSREDILLCYGHGATDFKQKWSLRKRHEQKDLHPLSGDGALCARPNRSAA